MFSSSGAKIKAASYVGWLVFSVWLTLPGFLWQINYFHNPKSAVYPLVVGLMLATPPLLVAWHILRRYGFRKYEFACLIGLPIVFCIVTEPAAAMVVLVTAASCFSFGKFVLKCLLLNPASAVEELALPLSVGLGFLHCCLFVLGLLGLYYPAVFTLLLG